MFAIIQASYVFYPITEGLRFHLFYRLFFTGSPDVGYLSFNKYESYLLFKVLSDRSERSNTIVTTNLPFTKWTELIEKTTMVSALVDRLTYRSHVLDISGPSYRLMSTQAEGSAW